MKLHLGVIDMPYTNENGSTTTGRVATFLENKYAIMEHFAEDAESVIDTAVADALAGVLENHMLGAPMPDDVLGAAAGPIEHRFKQYLDNEEMAAHGADTPSGLPIPTQAALDGVTHRKGAKKGDRRPSFIDTGMYQSSFKAWGEE